ncbi:MAG: WecB/TagA/CpsF family glycosyltransferase [Defluviitaleaceae bacterium]|nr:WecB/TagA/CpsF family glycosyltransferase [Defluviitaleaceae bacterium]MCL2239744.1 WecB/TagA/CpsF family glycosyltransferase [Defluviitaleaceae bacterium]
MRTVEILGVPFAALAFDEALALLESYLSGTRNHIVVTPNPEGVMLARRDPAFAGAVAQADLRLADGTGIVLAARYKGTPLPQRVRGVDITFALLRRLSAKGGSVYFLGAAPGVAGKAKARVEEQFPGVRVVGTQHGYFPPEEEDAILADIRGKRPDLLLVCTGMPRAEIWATRHRDLPARVTLCAGGTLDILGGNIRLAPAFWRRIGLEWLYRLLTQPSRARRMLDIPRFIWAVMQGK